MLKLFNRKKKDNKGFTLVELVIVVAILAILVGLLAPQYTKYVEKSRKAADASNMNELVKVVQTFAGDTDNELPAGKYTITIGAADATNTGITPDSVPAALKTELDAASPSWDSKLTTKSKKWDAGKQSDIKAEIEIKADGGVVVKYSPADFASYMGGDTISAIPAGGNGGSQQGGDNTQQGGN